MHILPPCHLSYRRLFLSSLFPQADLAIIPFREFKMSLGISDYHERLVLDTIRKTASSMAVFLNPDAQCRGVSQTSREVLVIVTGGTHDVAAIELAARLQTVPGVRIQVSYATSRS